LVGAGIIQEIGDTISLSEEWAHQPFLRAYIEWKRHTIDFWANSSAVIRGQMRAVYGGDIYTHLVQNPELFPIFHGAVEVLNGPDLEKMTKDCIRFFAGLQRPLRVLDLGAGSACLTLGIINAIPEATGVLVDLNVEAARLGAKLGAVDERCEFVEADFFSTRLPAVDVVVLSNVLCDWSDEQAATLVGRAATALSASGLLLVSEHVPQGGGESLSNLLSDFIVAMETQGATRTSEQLQDLLRPRFSVMECIAYGSGQSLFVCKPVTGAQPTP